MEKLKVEKPIKRTCYIASDGKVFDYPEIANYEEQYALQDEVLRYELFLAVIQRISQELPTMERQDIRIIVEMVFDLCNIVPQK